MVRGSDPVKQRLWSERLERCAKSGQTIEEFCKAEGVSATSFYQWKRKLGCGDRSRKKRGNGNRRRKPSAFKRLHISSADISAGVSIRLPDGIVIDLGRDLGTIEKVVAQVLDRQALSGAGSC